MKNIRIRIKTDGSIAVSADISVALSKIENVMQDRLDWIIENSRRLAEKNSQQVLDKSKINEPKLVNGTMFRIFGNMYTLMISTGLSERYYSDNNMLFIEVCDIENKSAIEISILRFIAEKGREIVEKYIDFYLKKSGYTGIVPSLSMKMLKSKWGHFNPRDNEIMLNYALAGLPVYLIEYVTAHEVAHIFIRNHSKLFYDFGERLLPDFKKFDRELNKYTTELWVNMYTR